MFRNGVICRKNDTFWSLKFGVLFVPESAHLSVSQFYWMLKILKWQKIFEYFVQNCFVWFFSGLFENKTYLWHIFLFNFFEFKVRGWNKTKFLFSIRGNNTFLKKKHKTQGQKMLSSSYIIVKLRSIKHKLNINNDHVQNSKRIYTIIPMNAFSPGKWNTVSGSASTTQ